MREVQFLQSSETLQKLRESFSHARSLKFAVAFLKKSGYDEIREDLLSLLKKGKPAELVVGISSYGITDWKVLQDLLNLSAKHGSLAVKYYNNEGFHPKLFIFEFPQDDWGIILGSSNLTGGGVRKNVEANIFLKGSSSEKTIEDVLEFFKSVFRTADPLNARIIKDYRLISTSSRRAEHRPTSRRIEKTPLVPMPEVGVKIPVRYIQRRALRGKSFYKIAPGYRASHWPLWEREIRVDREGVRWGIIAIGWSFDMTRLPFHDEERLRSVVEEKLRQVDINSDPNYVARQARLFCREIRKGDIVVAYSKGHIYGIGQAADDAPYYVDVKGHMHETYENRRRVKWLALGKWRPEERFARVLRYPNDTIHKITDPATVRMIRKRAQESRDQ